MEIVLGLINLSLGYVGGSANLVQEKLHVTMKPDGTNIKTSLEESTYSLEAPADEQNINENQHICNHSVIAYITSCVFYV